jgi:hypothetical protein
MRSFLPKIRITCQEEIEKECGFIERFGFRFTPVAALARRMGLPSIVSTREIKKPPCV